MVKLHIILHKGTVVAISEEKKDIEAYMEAKNFRTGYDCLEVKGKIADRVMLDFDDLYLEHDVKLDMVLTRMELRLLDDILGEEKSRIASTISDLKHYLRNYKLSKKDKSVLKKALSIMGSSKKTKRLKKIIKLDEFLSHFGFSSIQKKFIETADRMFIFINKK